MGLTTVGTEALRSFTLNDVPLHFVTVCPHCSTRLRIKSVYKSQSVRCKRCNDKFWAEEADGPHTTNSNESGVVQLAQAPPKEDRIVVTCPGCTATLRVRQSHVGHRVACKRCAHVFIGTWPTESALDPGLAGSPATTTPGAFPLESQSNHVESDTRLKALPSQCERLLAENQQLKTRKQQLKIRKQQLKAELQGLKDAHDQLAAENKRLNARKQQLKIRKQQLKAELQDLKDVHDQLSSENQKLRTLLDQTQAAHDRLSEQLDRATADLEGLRTELGEVTPGEVRSLVEEKASLTSEVERLAGEIQYLRDEQSALDRAADQLKRTDADLNAALAEVERCTGLLKERDDGLETGRADQHRLGVARQKALDEAEQLRSVLAEREETRRDEASRLRAKNDQLRSEHDALRRALDHAEQAHRDELTRFEQQLEQAREQSREVEVLRVKGDGLRTEPRATPGRSRAAPLGGRGASSDPRPRRTGVP